MYLFRKGTIEQLGTEKLVALVAVGPDFITISEGGDMLEIVGLAAVVIARLALLFGLNNKPRPERHLHPGELADSPPLARAYQVVPNVSR